MSITQALMEIAVSAGEAIMAIYGTDFAVDFKSDHSPVTAADAAAETLILAALAELLPGVPVVAEEAASAGLIPQVGARFVLVDPLDGTREFVSRNGEFTVNIALVEEGMPVAGVVYAPALATLYAGDRGRGAGRAAVVDGRIGPVEAIAVRAVPPAGLSVLCSRSHDTPETEAFLRPFRIAERRAAGSSLKFCLLAEGAADLYPRLGPTMAWDTAAGDAVLRGAGGHVVRFDDHTPLAYGKEGWDNPFFIAYAPGVDLKK